MRFLLAVVITAVLGLTPLDAVTVAPLTFEQLVNNSASVVLARVTDVRGELISGGRGIESVVTVDVVKGIKGPAARTLQFTVPGGRAGRYVNVIPGAPTFVAGDLAVVFLTSRGARLPVTTGLTQGIYRVHAGMVMPPLLQGQALGGRGDVQRRPVAVATFESTVRAIVDSAR